VKIKLLHVLGGLAYSSFFASCCYEKGAQLMWAFLNFEFMGKLGAARGRRFLKSCVFVEISQEHSRHYKKTTCRKNFCSILAVKILAFSSWKFLKSFSFLLLIIFGLFVHFVSWQNSSAFYRSNLNFYRLSIFEIFSAIAFILNQEGIL
jgi:hypothetical protein